ncbi:hypothetical protein F4678DRAFT_484588 [Xylaria arbuscula]|nr:hypothetical protein F4678DRAFT_484588 [Xylaria arbuscula]
MFQQSHRETISRVVRKFIDTVKPSPYNITPPESPVLDRSIPAIAVAGLSPPSSRVSLLGRSKAPAAIPSPRSLSKPAAHASSPESPSGRAAGRSQESLTSQSSDDSDPADPAKCKEGLSAPPPSNDNVAPSSNGEGVSARKDSQKTKKERREAREKRKREKPQRVARAGALIKAFHNNKPLDQFTGEIDIQEDIVAVDLYLDEYRDLLREIEEDSDLDRYFHSRLKYEYASRKRTKQFDIRIPGPVHANLTGAINSAITEWSASVRNGTFRSYTVKRGSDTNVPDGSFELTGIKDFRHGGLVIEVGWTQTSSDLSQKCQEYIKKSKGRIRTVVGIDLHELYNCYKTVIGRVGKVTAGEEKATGIKRIHEMARETLQREATGKISVWYSQWDRATNTAEAKIAFSNHVCESPLFSSFYNVVKTNQEFRDKDGKPIGNVALCLSLQAFISERVEDRYLSSHNPRCAISAEFLCSRLDDGLEEMLTDALADPGDEESVATQINSHQDLLSRLVEDRSELSGSPSFLPKPPTPHVNPAEDNVGRSNKILQILRRSSRIASQKA